MQHCIPSACSAVAAFRFAWPSGRALLGYSNCHDGDLVPGLTNCFLCFASNVQVKAATKKGGNIFGKK